MVEKYSAKPIWFSLLNQASAAIISERLYLWLGLKASIFLKRALKLGEIYPRMFISPVRLQYWKNTSCTYGF
jgi:hypothetical protein